MTITLEDVAYQLGLAAEWEPVSGCMTGWETFYEGRTMEDLCQQLLGVVPGENDRHAAGKWVVNMTCILNCTALLMLYVLTAMRTSSLFSNCWPTSNSAVGSSSGPPDPGRHPSSSHQDSVWKSDLDIRKVEK
ncbi:hypothetical protein PIB30_008144 [Stylosanthes scabra]|uniref:Uncharacterized protein n=1 Tax=Stylosanthes scabra TaxID=79078 RepID=A0ABU6Y1E1_9FABA|nr:hypothetical protein [Stylosanthes scabra]